MSQKRMQQEMDGTMVIRMPKALKRRLAIIAADASKPNQKAVTASDVAREILHDGVQQKNGR